MQTPKEAISVQLTRTLATFNPPHGEDDIGDMLYEFRAGEVETNIPTEWSRHYESKSVAAKLHDGRWVGWTYWYGGGKHGEPESIPWMEDAYFLDCKEEEVVITKRTFTKIVDFKEEEGNTEA